MTENDKPRQALRVEARAQGGGVDLDDPRWKDLVSFWREENALAEAMETGRELTPEESEAIHRDFADPDNWLLIPEFDVMPHDVELVGFSYPICRGSLPPLNDWRFRSAAENVRTSVGIARTLLRRSFPTLSEAYDLAGRWIDQYHDAIAAGNEPRITDTREFAAVSYMQFIRCMRSGMAAPSVESQMQWIAVGSVTLALWQSGDMRRMSAALKKAEPLLRRDGRGVLTKTVFYRSMLARHPRLGDKDLANLIVDETTAADDGVSPFYWGPRHSLMDRARGVETTVAKMTEQIRKARGRPSKKDT